MSRFRIGALLLLVIASCTRSWASESPADKAASRGAPGSSESPTALGAPDTWSEVFALRGRIIYRSGESTLVAVDPVDPANTSTLVPDEKVDLVAWSPDGSRLLVWKYSGGCGGYGVLFVVEADGSEMRLGCSGGGSFSPTGSRIVYGGIYVIGVDGENRRRLVRGTMETGWVWDPEWSPGGSRIAFSVYYEGEPRPLSKYGIDIVRRDGSHRREVVRRGLFRGGVTWSPNGSWLVFPTHTARGGPDIFTVRTDGSALHKLTDGETPAWSPDGSRIAFVREGELFTMAADGSDVQQVQGPLPPMIDRFPRLVWG
jgi:Tol biopolymer transport system component